MTTTISPDLSITVYSKPNCNQCRATYRKLDKARIEYTVVDITTDPAGEAIARATGELSMPIVVTADGTWGGFRDERLAAFIAKVAAAAEVESELVAA